MSIIYDHRYSAYIIHVGTRGRPTTHVRINKTKQNRTIVRHNKCIVVPRIRAASGKVVRREGTEPCMP